MSKGQKHSSREHKKPKQNKPKTLPIGTKGSNTTKPDAASGVKNKSGYIFRSGRCARIGAYT